MTKKWRSSTWGDEISLEYGKGIRGYSESNGEFRVFGSNGPIGWTSTPLAPGPGVVLGRKGAYRGVAFSERPFFVIDTAYYLVPKTDIDMRWLYYAVIHHKLGEIDDGSPIPSTTRAAVYVRPIDIPPIEEQKAISYILGSLDDLIETNRRTNEALEAMARAIFKDWFVDFGPVRAKAEGRAPYLAPEIWSLFPDSLDDEDKPDGWSEKRIDDVLELAYGKALPASERVDGLIPVYGSGGITGYHNASLVDGPSIIVGRKGTVGSLYWEDRPFYPIDTVFYVVPKIELTYCLYLLETLGLHEMNTDAAVPGLNRNNVYRLKFPWSSDGLRYAFDERIRPIRQMVSANNEESKTLLATRDFLLPKLMSGEIRVKDAEHLIQQAV